MNTIAAVNTKTLFCVKLGFVGITYLPTFRRNLLQYRRGKRVFS